MSTAENQMDSKTASAAEIRKRKIADVVNAGLKRRYAAERRFRFYGVAAIAISMIMLVVLFTTILGNGLTAFVQTRVTMDVVASAERIDPQGTRKREDLVAGDYQGAVRDAVLAMFPEVTARKDRKDLMELFSNGAGYELQRKVLENPDLIGKTVRVEVPVASEFDMLSKGYISRDVPEAERKISDKQIGWFDTLKSKGMISMGFNTTLMSSGDSRQPELAGLWGAIVGSFYTLVVTLTLSFPIGVAAAIYLEEFAPKNKWTDIIEVNINNLAAVPSIVFGLLGLAVFLQFFGLPRSAPVVGGLVLMLMNLPIIIIASRAALKSVPPSIREAALGLGASKLQMIFHHVLPLAMPGMLTGTIIGMAHALGETAPLLMIGMVAFIVDIPHTPLDPSTVLPVQIYLWADSPERAFVERTSAAIIVLLGFLILMNAAAVLLRKKFERRW
ncbi:phosphate ABC transporter permease PstA [Novispirillum itersonii subsp. nipponicum]